MALIELIEESVIKVPLLSNKKPDIIRELIAILEKAGKISNPDTIYAAVLDRESKGSTGLEEGIAVPHAKTTAVKDLTLAIGIAPKGVDFAALDGKPSQIFFLMLAPPDKAGPHIAALADIARITRSKAFCRLLLAAQSPAEVVELFKED
jgi:fructose-specific phosphotransferase system IIA component